MLKKEKKACRFERFLIQLILLEAFYIIFRNLNSGTLNIYFLLSLSTLGGSSAMNRIYFLLL